MSPLRVGSSPVSLDSLLGQDTALQTLKRALAGNRVHHAYRFEGPEGVGKETAAFLLAQALLCESSGEKPCAECSSCKRAVTFAKEPPEVPRHPDVILVGRGVYPPALLGGASEATGISVEQVRRIVLARTGYPPHEGRAMIFIIRDADELNQSAANALLKTLEEPHRGTHFILLTSRPAKLLDTILSRTLAVRFGPLPPNAMKILLEREGLPLETIEFAQGSLARARMLAHEDVREARDGFLRAVDTAVSAGNCAAALTLADARPEGRSEIIAQLRHVATAFATRARTGEESLRWANSYREVTRSIREVEANGSPALVLEALINRLHRV